MLLGTFIATVFYLAIAWWIFTRKGNEPRNSYESLKRDLRRFFGVMCLGAGLLAGWYTIAQLMAPDKPVVVHKVVKHRKPIPTTTEDQ